MLDSIKSLTGNSKLQKQQAEDLQALIASAREERAALTEMLNQISVRTPKLAQLGKSFEQVGQKADSANAALDALDKRLVAFDTRIRAAEAVEQRVAHLAAQVTDAQKISDKILATDGDLQKHRQAVNQLASQALETQATVETLRKERATLEEVREQLRQSTADVKHSVDGAGVLKNELDGVRAASAQLSQEYQRIRDTSREARDNAAAAADSVKDVEKKLGPLVQLQELSKSTEERLASLNALAEHVSHKVKALEAQKHAIDHATVQSNRLNEMVWSMDEQINKLTEGHKQIQRAEESVTKMEKLAQETEAHLATATEGREVFARELSRVEKESRSLAEYLKINVERLGVEKKEFDAFDLRLKALQKGIADAEGRTDALLARDKTLNDLTQKADTLNKNFQTLGTQADDLARKQSALESLGERLAQVDELGRRTTAQQEALKQNGKDLDALRKEIQDFHKAHAEAVQLSDRLRSDRALLETFDERARALLARTPELETRMDTILGKMTMVEEGTRSATRLGELAGELDAQVTRVGARLQFIEQLDGRINNLHGVTSDVDKKLAEQLARRAELDTLKGLCDTVATQVADAQQKLDGVAALQSKLPPLVAEVERVGNALQQAALQVKSVQRDENVVIDQRTRLSELVEQGRNLATEVADRVKQVQSVNEELTRATTAKDELLTELARVQARQHDAISQTEATDDQLKRAETMLKQLEQRRTQLSFSEKKISSYELRLNELKQLTDSVDQKIKAITDREGLVQAVKAEVDTVYQISSRSKADLQFVVDHRNDVAVLRNQVEDLLARVSDTDQKIVAIEARRKSVEDVQARTNAITNLLDDIHVNLEMLGEQKAVIDHVGEKLARLDFMVQEAQSTLRGLQREREIAERIEQSIKTLRARKGSGAAEKTA